MRLWRKGVKTSRQSSVVRRQSVVVER